MLPKFLRNQEQMRLNIGKKLKTASLNSRFTGSKKEESTLTCSFLKNSETYRAKVTVNGILRHLKKIVVWKKLFLFHIDPKI